METVGLRARGQGTPHGTTPRADGFARSETNMGSEGDRAQLQSFELETAKAHFVELGRALQELAARVDGRLSQAVRVLLETGGHVVITGIGKSGLVGQKLAATFASTGTPSFFLHAADAFHGDLGMITPRDAVVLISYSGETEEVVRLLPHLRARKVPTIALVGGMSSALAKGVDVALDVSVGREVCPNNLAPTTSTLAVMAMGDVLAMLLSRHRGFGPEDFARLHPEGSLGRRLQRVRDLMQRAPLPKLLPRATVRECLLAFAHQPIKLVAVVDDAGRLIGSVDGRSLGHALEEEGLDEPVGKIMRRNPPAVDAEILLADAVAYMEREECDTAFVIERDRSVCGLLHRDGG